jgi:hypothetical protein
LGKKRGTLNESWGKGKEKPKNQQDKEMKRVAPWSRRQGSLLLGKIRFVVKFHPTVPHKKIFDWVEYGESCH